MSLTLSRGKDRNVRRHSVVHLFVNVTSRYFRRHLYPWTKDEPRRRRTTTPVHPSRTYPSLFLRPTSPQLPRSVIDPRKWRGDSRSLPVRLRHVLESFGLPDRRSGWKTWYTGYRSVKRDWGKQVTFHPTSPVIPPKEPGRYCLQGFETIHILGGPQGTGWGLNGLGTDIPVPDPLNNGFGEGSLSTPSHEAFRRPYSYSSLTVPCTFERSLETLGS